MTRLDAVVVGAGFSGLYMMHLLRQRGLTAQGFEAGKDVGGTWYWNRYPGARCDSESLSYSYSFLPELDQAWKWPERYAEQPEILKYIEHVATTLDLRSAFQFETRVTAATFNEADDTWTVETGSGDQVTARYLIMATGCLSKPNMPDIPGIDSFRGDAFHTGLWPHGGVDFSGQRVAVIGTGSTGIQSIPHIANQASQLFVFQRTANHCVPARNGPMDPVVERTYKSRYSHMREKARHSMAGDVVPESYVTIMKLSPQERRKEFNRVWSQGGFYTQYPFTDLMTDIRANDLVADYSREHIRNKIRNPRTAELLCAKDHPFGTKRLCADTGYFESYNEEHVHLVDLNTTPIRAITPTGVEVSDGHYEVDAIVYATGFNAMTGALTAVDIRGSSGEILRDAWTGGPVNYLGLSVAGFPNLFTVTGPGSPSVLTNMVSSIEQHVEWIDRCVASLEERGATRIEATPEAQATWVQYVNDTADATLYPQANSWYIGANIPGKARVFMPYVDGLKDYRDRCDAVADDGYAGFTVA
ncbi:MAG: NAD(P)/FAD-dependent oxidoreductase [Alphaproteobacteria bacterium]|jgi:cyclohexanone monooxygenase|nr:NAD(P)/FAD-dependent oxidoreductase [Rhodospirillaceae bacterium]MBT7646075.1 NAD(P)/FAD-dependent oxidoreductase [Rhodospirillaceae bacterium]MDG2479641.1 NAD(P)/FAD-dependent oxidoreductase [Alphaproteobacteria bacterium]